ncbi:hypothetical protein Taro_049118, partial [Colocasia esculenta]|nr:hypothetical protein [Colocasia esculenta]
MLRLCRHESKSRSTRVDTDQEQVDTGPRSQNSLFAEWDKRSTQDQEQVDTGPRSQNKLGQEVDTTTRAGQHTTERLQLKMDDCHVSS